MLVDRFAVKQVKNSILMLMFFDLLMIMAQVISFFQAFPIFLHKRLLH